jgi:bifunctional UDP-N-acetylglucosamine pyrophosphorylase/glucosamine-1-phosphate N-acetyltransferase
MRRMSLCQAVVLAAGRGTRMRSTRPKVLQRVSGLPMLEYVLRALDEASPNPRTIVVGRGGEIEAAFAGRGLSFVVQDPPSGTGDALRSALGAFSAHPDHPVLVLNGDLPLLRAATVTTLLEHHRALGRGACLLTVRPKDPGAYGRIVRNAAGRVERIVEAKDATAAEKTIGEVNAGAYVFDAPLLADALRALQTNNAQGEYYLTDLISVIASRGLPLEAVEVQDAEEARGVNTMGELAEATRAVSARKVAALLESGVRIEDPTTTHVDPDCEVAPDALIRPFTFLEGRTRIGAGAEIGPFARLVSVDVGAGAQVLDHTVLREAWVEEGASVGPFAQLRPGSRVGQGARVGNFVELKNTHLGKGSKAQHLAYLGDATIGENVNIGAGTITCNYDGTHKHPTRIEDGAFVGSDSTLVAPVTIGKGAYVAAGSTITADVPEGALALGRARQVVKPDWVRKAKR